MSVKKEVILEIDLVVVVLVKLSQVVLAPDMVVVAQIFVLQVH